MRWCGAAPTPFWEGDQVPKGEVPNGGWCVNGVDFCGYDTEVWACVFLVCAKHRACVLANLLDVCSTDFAHAVLPVNAIITCLLRLVCNALHIYVYTDKPSWLVKIIYILNHRQFAHQITQSSQAGA